MKTKRFAYSVGIMTGVLLSCLGWVSHGFSQTDFYKGKTITIVASGGPGGTGEFQIRVLLPVLKKHTPGHPSFVIQNMPGAGGRKAANYIHNKARPNGLTIGAIGGGLVIGKMLGLPGVNYSLGKFHYLGSTEVGYPYIFFTRREAGFDSVDKLRSAPVVKIGAQGVGHPVYISERVFAYVLGIKNAKFVTGYSGAELDLAVQRGEVDGRTSAAGTILARSPHFIEKKLMNFHATISSPKGRHPDGFAKVPDLDNFAKTEKTHRLLALYRAYTYIKWPYILPPGTPKERVDILRGAMLKSFNDPEFKKRFKKFMHRDATPLTPDDVQKAIREIPRNPEDSALLKKLSGPGPLPAR